MRVGSKGALISSLVVIQALQGCSNNLTTTLTVSATTVEAPSPISGSTNGGTGGVSLVQVVKNNKDPNGTIDLIGDGTGAFGNLCKSTSNPPVASGTTNCNCTLSYNTTSYPNQSVDTPTTYHEGNLVRCSYSAIPTGVTAFSVSIHDTNSNTYSNTVQFSTSSGTNNVNTSLTSNYVNPVRYQCRDAVTIPFMFDSSIYDPIHSEDPHLSFPLNFYATNLGYVTSILGSNATVGWICPPILNPSSYLTSSALLEFNSAYQLNMNVYSIGPDNNNSYFIYSPTGDNKRSTFYLSKTKTSVFNIPIDAYIAPNTNTSPNGTYPPLGYGAAPIPAGSGQEVCPSNIPIPAGFQWVKLWQFRAGLPQRKFAISTDIMNIGAIYCNPGDWPDSNNVQQPIFQGCFLEKENKRNSSPYSLSMNDIDNATYFFADRVLSLGGGNSCVRLQENDGTAPCASAGGGNYHPGAGCGNGADLWEEQDPYKWDGNSSTNTTYLSHSACSNVPILDPVNSCATANNVHTDPKGNAQHPFTFHVQYQDYDTIQGDGSGRYDFIFVVSPQSVMLQDMKNTSTSSSTLAYQPYRYFTNTDCDPGIPGNSDPSRPDGNCNSTNIIHYGLTLQDVGSNGDTPANSTTNPPIFPVCALQPI